MMGIVMVKSKRPGEAIHARPSLLISRPTRFFLLVSVLEGAAEGTRRGIAWIA